MTREIKFRAWDKNHNNMIYPGSEDDATRSQYTVGDILYLFEDEDIMQYTGLKDKNGVEIYEGDIVQRPEDEDMGKTYKEGIGYVKYNITRGRYDIGYLHEHNSEIKGSIMNSLKHCNHLIIGNIHENKDLLTS